MGFSWYSSAPPWHYHDIRWSDHPTLDLVLPEILGALLIATKRLPEPHFALHLTVSRLQLKCDGTREGKWRGKWRMEWVASTVHTTSEHGVSSITTADAHTSAAGSRLNWRPRRFKWTRPFRRKTKSGFCACAITFQTQSTNRLQQQEARTDHIFFCRRICVPKQ